MPRHGFIKDKLDIKILILYILQRIPIALSFDQITQLIRYSDDYLDYFLYAEALDELVTTDHITKSPDGMYLITEKGKENGKICETSIAYSVRKKAEASVEELKPEFMRNALISTDVIDGADGCATVSLSLSDDCGEIMKLEMLAGNRKQATEIARNFRRSAELIYNAVMQDLMKTY